MERIAVITGASRGIGAAAAKRLARDGVHCYLVARSLGGLEETDDAIRRAGGRATLVPMDLTDYACIDRLGASLHQVHGKLDILIGNAGMLGDLAPVAHADPKVVEKVMAVNVTANARLIRSLDPLLRASAAGRAMFVTSGVTQSVFPYWGPYAASKAALESLVLTYAAEVAHSNLRVNLIDPGVVRTAMRAAAMPGENPMSLPAPEDMAEVFAELASPDCRLHGQRVAARVAVV